MGIRVAIMLEKLDCPTHLVNRLPKLIDQRVNPYSQLVNPNWSIPTQLVDWSTIISLSDCWATITDRG